MSCLLTYKGTIYPWHCDHMGHMNVMWYVGKFDEATWNVAAMVGMTPSYIRDSGCGAAAVQQNITYKHELFAGDTIVIHSRVLEVREKAVRFVHVMTNAETGVEAAVCELTGVHVDRQLRKAVPFPPAIAARLAALVLEPEPA
jgi:acyl-CoA thioester hydrolase